jgi:REP element-mobilizing transposase RayT
MPNHVHLIVTVNREMSIEKAVQLVKGNFSYRAKKELGRFTTEIPVLLGFLSRKEKPQRLKPCKNPTFRHD